MKRIIMMLLAVLTIAVTSNSTKAQTVKFAHIDYEKVIDSIPSMMAADAEMKQFVERGQKQIMEMEKVLQDEYTQFEREKSTLSQIMQELRYKDLMERAEIIEYKKQSLENDYQILSERIYGPIQKNLEKAIEIVAQRHKVTYLLEKKSQTLYTDPNGGLDLTKEVRAEFLRLENERVAAGK